MRNGGKPLLSVLSILVFWTGARALAVTSTNTGPYESIVARNVFGLKDPPPPAPVEAPKPPAPKVLLQGITTIFGNKRAIIKLQVPPKPGEPPKGEQSFVMAEGQRDGDIEMLEIDPAAGKVKISNFGTVMDLDFENNGVKTPGGGAPAPALPGVPGAMPKPVGFTPAPPANPFLPSTGAPAVPMSRPLRAVPTSAGVSPATPAAYSGSPAANGFGMARLPAGYNAVPNPATYTAPPAAVGVGGTPNTTLSVPLTGGAASGSAGLKSWPPEVILSPEEAAIMEAAYKMKNADAIKNGSMPDIPGSNPLLDTPATQNQTTTQQQAPGNTLPLPPGRPLLPQ